MVIRDDRNGRVPAEWGAYHPAPSPKLIDRYPDHFAPDAVLYDCPDCGRAHFVRVGECPGLFEAAHEEAGMVRRAA